MCFSKDLLFARQPIFDSNKKLYAYELLYRDNNSSSAVFDSGDMATASVIINYCSGILEDEGTPNTKIFINFTRHLILSDYFFPLGPSRLVIEILEDVVVDDILVQRIIELKKKGYAFAIDDYAFERKFDDIIPLVDYIKFELLGVSVNEFNSKIIHFKEKINKENMPILLAEKVENQEIFDLCNNLGFKLFQGYFLEKPQPIYGKKISGNSQSALRILGKLQDVKMEMVELSHLISQDVRLSFLVLRIINSPLHRLPKKVNSLFEAVVYLGIDKIKKWATAIVISGSSEQGKELLLLLLTRARACEIIAEKQNHESPESFFTIGLFSGIDAVMLADKAWLLGKLAFSDEVNSAILEYVGQKGEVLKLVMDLEYGNHANLENLDIQSQIYFYQSHEVATSWANRLFHIL